LVTRTFDTHRGQPRGAQRRAKLRERARRWALPTPVQRHRERSLFKVLQDGIVESTSVDKIFNNLAIINFNYDRCVEHFMYHAMLHLYPSRGEAFIVELLNSTLKVIHPYGRVGNLIWQDRKNAAHFGMERTGDELAQLSTQIRTYNEEVDDTAKVEEIRKRMAEAQRIVFLGFHFHKQNVELIAPARESKDLFGGVEAYGTRVNRSDRDMAVVRDRLRQILHGRSLPSNKVFEKECDCKGFFTEYSTMLMG
jgi:hypothetical protein